MLCHSTPFPPPSPLKPTHHHAQIPFTAGSANHWPGQYSTNVGQPIDFGVLFVRILLPIGIWITCVLITRFWYKIWYLRPSWLQPAEEEHGSAAEEEEAKWQEGVAGAYRRFLGPNHILISLFPIMAAYCWQITDVRIGTGVGALVSLVIMCSGWLLWKNHLRRVSAGEGEGGKTGRLGPPLEFCSPLPLIVQAAVFTDDVAVFLTLFICFCICWPTGIYGSPSHNEWQLQNNLNFILCGSLGGLAAVSPDLAAKLFNEACALTSSDFSSTTSSSLVLRSPASSPAPSRSSTSRRASPGTAGTSLRSGLRP